MGRWNSPSRVENVLPTLTVKEFSTINIMQKAQETGERRRSHIENSITLPSLEQRPHLSIDDFVRILYTCKKRKDRAYALCLHAYMREIGLDTHRSLGNHLVSTLAEVGNMYDAHQVFDKLVDRNEWSCNSLITGYIKCGKPQCALALYEEMQKDNYVHVNGHSFIALLKACAKKKDLDTGIRIHANVASNGLLRSDPFVGNTLVDMYAKCGVLSKAQEVFDGLQTRDVVSWTALIGGYAEQGRGEEALKHFKRMQCEGVSPNGVTFVCSLKACSSLKAIHKGQEIHVEAERMGFMEHDLAVGNMVVDMYAKCGALDKAKQVFDKLLVRDVISWTALIAGSVECDDGEEALKCFAQMQLEGICPNAVTFASSLKSCGMIGAIDKGKQMHTPIEAMGTLERDPVIGNILVDMYAKCGLLNIAQDVFNNLRVQNVVGWTALISGYADYGHDEEAYKCFERMQAEGVSPDSLTLACSLKACGNMRAGQEIHAEIERIGCVMKDPFVGSTLVNMYAKCGSLLKAQEVFVKLPAQDATAWTALIAAYSVHGRFEEALKWYEKMQAKGVLPNAVTLVHCSKACGSLRATDKGREIHSKIEKMGLLEGDLVVGNALVDMYTKFSLLSEACGVFNKLPIRNIVSWNALIAGYVKHGLGDEAHQFLEQMQLEGVLPDSFTYICSLKTCGSIGAIDEVQKIHSEVEKKGLFESNLDVGNTLIDIYAKYGLLTTAHEIFKMLPFRDVVSWNALLTGYSEHGFGEEVLKNIKEMQLTNVSPDFVTFISGLRACGQVGAREKGQELHAEIERQGLLDSDLVVGNALVDMYGKCGLLAKAHEVFNNLPEKNIVSWTALIAGYVEHEHGEEALKCAEQMQLEGVSPNNVTFVCILKACIKAGVLDKAQETHGEIERRGILEKDLAIGNTLIDFYAKSGMVGKAREVFDRFPSRNALSWTTLIAGYAEDGHGEEAVNIFEHMQSEGISPDAHTFVCSLKACGMIGATELGQQIHSKIERNGLWEGDVFTSNTLVGMYAKCGSLIIAEQVFKKLPTRDIVAWNALITGYAEQGYGEKALNYFEQMLLEGVHPNAITFVGSLKACCTMRATEKGQEIHAMLDRSGLLDGDIVLSNTLLDMYAKFGLLAKVEELFDKLSVRNVVSWTTLIAGYTEHEHGKEALKCYDKMQFEGVPPNLVTCICSLKACGSIGAIEKGREIHAEIERKGFVEGVQVGNTLVHMYAKCGLVAEALNVFDKLPGGNIVSWNALIAGYSKLGENVNVFQMFNRMLQNGLKPSMVTFVIVLNACSRSCLFDCCLMYFEAMSKDYGVVLAVEHITSVVGLLCRAGQLNNALALINKMPVYPNLVVWRNMLNVCKDGGNIDLGKRVFERAMCLEKRDPAVYVLMSHVYAGAHRQEERKTGDGRLGVENFSKLST